MNHKKVVVTGMGVVSPIGSGQDKFFDALYRGECGVERITSFDSARYNCQIAAEIKDLDLAAILGPRRLQRTARFTQLALVAAQEAWKQSGLDIEKENPLKTAIILGVGIGGLEVDSETQSKLALKGPERVSAMTIPRMIANEAPGNMAMDFGIRGAAHVVTTACASGTDAIGHAIDYIRSGRADVVMTGGSEAAVTPFGVSTFCALKALSTRNDDPQHASRPFDKDRDGFIIGEGAGVLILESQEHALARGAVILAEAAGSAATTDGYHLTAPDPEGIGCASAITLALEDAQINPEEIGYLNAHGTSTPTNDPIETKAIKRAFGDWSKRMKISSIKGMIGHCLGAAGGIEALVCVKALQSGLLPPTINLDEPDPLCDLDYIPNKTIEKDVRAVMSTSLGFGGHNGVLIFRKY